MAENLKINVPTPDPERAFFELMSPLFKLTPKEIDILLTLYRIDPEQPARSLDRPKAVEELGLKNVPVLNTYIGNFCKRKILNKEKRGVYRFHPLLQKDPNLKSITFKLEPK